MHRFFLDAKDFEQDKVIFPAQIVHQLYRVLHFRKGMKVTVLDNQGYEFLVALEQVTAKEATGKIIDAYEVIYEPPISINLFLCLSQREKFEWMLQKCTEVGAGHFFPVISERSLVRHTSNIDNKMERWRNIIREASEQSGRGRIPTLHSVLTFSDVFSLPAKDMLLKIIPWEKERDTNLHSLLTPQFNKVKNREQSNKPSIDVFIGPEGGFSDGEIQSARHAGFIPVSLGRRILRMETAAVVATALILYELER